MRTRSRNRALLGIPLGMFIMAGSVVFYLKYPIYALAALLIAFVGLIVYCWGCSELAKAKGYDSAIVLTVFFFILPTLLMLLVLPDKNRVVKRW